MAKRYEGKVPGTNRIRYRHVKNDPYTLRGYEVRYRDRSTLDKNGKPAGRSKTFRTLDEAKAFQTENDHAIRRGTYISPAKQNRTWAEVSQQWLVAREVKLRPRTLIGYRNALGRWFSKWDRVPIGELTPEHVRGLLTDLRKAGLAVETEHRIFNVASGVFKWAQKERLIHESPCAVVRDELRSVTTKTFKAQALTKEQAEAIIGHISPGRNQLFARMLLWTGFRGGELAGLRVRNVDRLRNLVQVEDTIQDLGTLSIGTTKTAKSKGRRVPVPKGVMAEIGTFIDDNRMKLDDFLFSASAEFFNYANWSKRHWTPACRRAGFSETHTTAPRTKGKKPRVVQKATFRPYDLRHTFASLRAAEGVPPHVLKEWMGHTDITTTMNIYAHVYDGDPRMEALVERLYGPADDAVVQLSQADEA